MKRLNFIIVNSGVTNFKFVISLLVLKSFFEMIGIGIIYSFIDLILNKELIESNFLYKLLLFFELRLSVNNFVFLYGIASILFFVSSAFISITAKIKSDNLIWKMHSKIIAISFEKHINDTLTNFKSSNSSKTTNDIINEVRIFCSGFVVNFMDVIPRVFLLIFLTFFLLSVNPLVTLVSLIFLSVFYGVLMNLLKKKINKMSKNRYLYQNNLFDYVNSSIRALKDIRINSFEEYFVKKIENPASTFSMLSKGISIYSSTPKPFIESIVLIVITTFLTFSLDKDDITLQIPMISLLALSLIKLLPVIQGMFTNFTRLRFNFKSLKVIENNIRLNTQRESNTKVKREKFSSLEFKSINFSYSSKKVLENFSFKFNRGDFWLILGESGSGKTTFTEIMLGFLKPNSGEIYFNDKPWELNELLSKKTSLGYVSQDIVIFEGDLVENITLRLEKQKKLNNKKIYNLIDLCSLEDVVQSIGGIHGFISEGGKNLSAGQKQRIILARALYKEPELLILDEATSALNAKLERRILQKLLESKKSILMITHNENLKEFSSKTLTLK